MAIWISHTGKRYDSINACFIERDRSSATRRLYADLGKVAAKRAPRSGRTARCARRWQARIERAIHRAFANLSRDRYQELKLTEGEAVYVVPRQLRIFVADDDDAPSVPAERKD